MARCATCRRIILFGGIERGSRKFCTDACAQQASVASVELPDWEVDEALVRVHQGACAHCAGPGPVDAYGAHRVVSMIWTVMRGP